MAMEKVGIEKEELKKELQEKYNTLKEKAVSFEKVGAVTTNVEMEMDLIKAKIDELE